ncbi:MAG: hypothetical protein ACD_49C00093G0004 [uncultured bacterium (gcode 4)]|uniref:Uncharacterized protein n=1 Tax=uncultured bacterium (gcode 4) TaxID=1234023 RepID=K2BAL2_9BACT|nr:MAG: hypothetical protein ACD_49C00093G0004 [uncultured bacterium (gcode 4)]
MSNPENKNKNDSIYDPLIWESFLSHPSEEEQKRNKIEAQKNVNLLKHKIETKKNAESLKSKIETKPALSLLKEKVSLSLENKWKKNEKLDKEINEIYETVKDSDEANFIIWIYYLIEKNDIVRMTDFFKKSLKISDRFSMQIFELIAELKPVIIDKRYRNDKNILYFMKTFRSVIEEIIKNDLKIVKNQGEKKELLDLQKFLKTL